jgi:hypothetical protein
LGGGAALFVCGAWTWRVWISSGAGGGVLLVNGVGDGGSWERAGRINFGSSPTTLW